MACRLPHGWRSSIHPGCVIGVREGLARLVRVLESKSELEAGALDHRNLLLKLLVGDEEVICDAPIVCEPRAERVKQSAVQLVDQPGFPNPEVDTRFVR